MQFGDEEVVAQIENLTLIADYVVTGDAAELVFDDMREVASVWKRGRSPHVVGEVRHAALVAVLREKKNAYGRFSRESGALSVVTFV